LSALCSFSPLTHCVEERLFHDLQTTALDVLPDIGGRHIIGECGPPGERRGPRADEFAVGFGEALVGRIDLNGKNVKGINRLACVNPKADALTSLH
jgi:hypothetical protein